MRDRHVLRWFVALLAVFALIAAACAEEEEGADGDAGGDQVDFTSCLVTDTGGVDDRSFNQAGFEGMQQAQDELGTNDPQVLESQTPDDFEPNINQFLQQDCDLIITQGFLLGDATAKAAEANPDQNFAIIDVDFFDVEKGEDVTYDNVKELTFKTDEAAFMAGYLAAGVTKSGKIGTYGGINIPTVTIFMNGLAGGVDYYNQQKGTNVEVLGWNADTQKGLFTGDFENQDKGRRITESLLSEGADIILPVAGPVGLGTTAAVQDAGEGSVIWVDTDGCITAAEFCDLFLTSILKNISVAVSDTIREAAEGNLEGGLYIGTLENDGIGLAPYHEFEDDVPSELDAEVQEIKQGIIDGSISMEP